MKTQAEEEFEAKVIAYAERLLAETRSLRTLIAGEDEAGQSLYVSTEMRLDAISRLAEILEEVGGEPLENWKEQLRLIAPDALAVLARLALGLDDSGNRTRIDPGVQQDARNGLASYGIVEPGEFRTISLAELLRRIDAFVVAQASLENA